MNNILQQYFPDVIIDYIITPFLKNIRRRYKKSAKYSKQELDRIRLFNKERISRIHEANRQEKVRQKRIEACQQNFRTIGRGVRRLPSHFFM